MGIIRFTPSVGADFECEVSVEDLKHTTDGHLVRPCERYKELYKDCSSIAARIHQYYVFGDFTDCSQHKDNYNSCLKYRKTKNLQLLDPIIKWERDLIQKRLDVARSNPCWEMRDEPPTDFNGPLPEFTEMLHKNSRFRKLKKLLESDP